MLSYDLASPSPPTRLFRQHVVSLSQSSGLLCHRLKVPKREIFDRSDFPDFDTIKSSWVGDLLLKILTYYFNFLES